MSNSRILRGISSLNAFALHLGAVAALTSCGDLSDPFSLPKPKSKTTPALIFADTLAPHERVVPHSYIVAFRTKAALGTFGSSTSQGGDSTQPQVGRSSFRAEYRAAILALRDAGVAGDRVAVQHLIAIRAGSLLPERANALTNWRQTKGIPFFDSKPAGDPNDTLDIAKVTFQDEAEARLWLERWHGEGRIEFADPNYESEAAATLAEASETYASGSYEWHQAVRVPEALAALAEGGTTEGSPIVAVMDTGVDTSHPGLVPNLWENPSQGLASCGANDEFGCNTAANRPGVLGNGEIWPFDTDGPGESCPATSTASPCPHGTHVAGIVAAVPEKNYGGVCPICRVLVIRAVNEKGLFTDDAIIAGFRYIAQFSSVRILNGSFGKFSRSRNVAVVIKALFSESPGILTVAAAGNEATNLRVYIGAYGPAIAVANINASDRSKNTSSNYGQWVDIAAPGAVAEGSGIMSTVPGGGAKAEVGTSMASPFVAGAAGLLLAINPNMPASAMRDRLLLTADPDLYNASGNEAFLFGVGGGEAPVPLLGTGLLDVYAAVKNERVRGLTSSLTKRVEAFSCGTVAAGAGASGRLGGFLAFTCLLVLPMLLIALNRRRS